MSPRDEYRRKTALRRFLSDFLARLGIHFYDMYYGEIDLGRPLVEVEPSLEFEIGKASREDLPEILQVLNPERKRSFQHSIDIGSSCIVARYRGRIAGYSWCQQRVIDLAGLTVRELPAKVGYTYNSFVLPEFRGKKLFQRLTLAVYRDFREQGFSFVGNLVDRANTPSIAARQRLGVTFQSARFLKLPGLAPMELGKAIVIGAAPGGAARRAAPRLR
jgi:ribosomal protein S18 acetylase RimI-like enzyme